MLSKSKLNKLACSIAIIYFLKPSHFQIVQLFRMTKYKDLDSSFDEDLQDEDYYLSDNDNEGENNKINDLMQQVEH